MQNAGRLIPAGAFFGLRFKSTAQARAVVKAEKTARARAAAVKDIKARALARVPVRTELLSDRLLSLKTSGGAVSQALKQYVIDRKIMKLCEIDSCVKELRDLKRYDHALAILQWMEDTGISLSFADCAVRLDLTSKVKGITAAENYFDGLSPSERNQLTYAALLKCYCDEKLTDKALAFFQKMEAVGLLSGVAYECLISLYWGLGQPQKVAPLIEEMKTRYFSLSNFVYSCWMHSCAGLNDIDGAGKVVKEMERDQGKVTEWTVYSDLASMYVRAGLSEKAELALRNIEEMRPLDREAYHSLIRLYARTCNLDGVERAWDCLKKDFKRTHTSYLVMLRALAILNNMDGLKVCFEEWKLRFSNFELKVANAAMGAYLRWDMLEDARQVFREATERSQGPFGGSRELFARFFLRRRELGSALEQMDAAVSEGTNGVWQPCPDLVNEFFQCLEEEKDVDRAEELCKILKRVNSLDCGAYRSLIRIYAEAGKAAPDMRNRLVMDGIEVSSDLENVLKVVCTR